ncbi:MAG TPA: helix-turn-helix domain-containing protein [Anaerolineae bacterium]|nr:helix-turn-helix domain-containing protein [Anaerolineae bacterium]HOR01357.1 helix-turn-helix domain-containing protein [Anaerolineae bacterium]
MAYHFRFVRPLKADEYAQLTHTFKTSKDVRLVHRCQAILLSADGWVVTKIAELLRVDQSTIHRWLDRFEADGVQGLRIQWSPGRPLIEMSTRSRAIYGIMGAWQNGDLY